MACKSQIDEFAARVHPRDGHRKLFAMIEAYIDESGIHGDATVCVVAGYFGRRNHWKHLDTAWRKVLHRHECPLADFHAKKQIKQEKYKPMLLELARTISKYQIYPVSMIIAVTDFNAFSLEQRRWLTGGSFRKGELVSSGAPSKPYFAPFQIVLQRVTEYARPGTKAHFFCGLNSQFADFALALFRKIKTDPPRPHSTWTAKSRLGNIDFPLASETPALQAADLFAHLTYLHMLDRMKHSSLKNSAWKMSEMLELCLKNRRSQNDNACQDRDAIIATFEKASAMARRHGLSD